jgi:hypothetical protein
MVQSGKSLTRRSACGAGAALIASAVTAMPLSDDRASAQTLPPPGDRWRALVRKTGTPEFAAAFVKNPVLKATLLNDACQGVDNIAAFFGNAPQLYDARLTFTRETINGPKTYFEWEGKAFGQGVSGVTVLTHDEGGLIQEVSIFHRPLSVAARLSKELGKRVEGKMDASLFGVSDGS